MAVGAPDPDGRACRHEGFHAVTTRYDRAHGVLVYIAVCEACGELVSRIGSVRYRPHFNRSGHEAFLTGQR